LRRRPRLVGVAIIGFAVAALLALIVGLSIENPNDHPLRITGAGEVQELLGGIQQSNATLGSSSAPVTIDFYNDIQCSFCEDYQLAVVPALVNDLVRPGKAKLVYRHFAFGEAANGLADYGAVAAAQQDDQWQFLELFAINRGQAAHHQINEDYLSNVASAIIEFDLNKWRSDFHDTSKIKSVLDADNQLTIGLRLRGNPAAVVAGPSGHRILQDKPSVAAIEAAVAAVGPH
jgi:protein-disulfide isomerase